MAKKLVDIDEETLARAREILGADTMKQTVNEALAEVVRLAERRSHVARLAEMDGLDLDDEDVMADAWR
ncbi:MAG: type II toxin-antitoxin system VapB family antitoxin [Actinobacteria bacterium]|nr:type II toxin-antitoxin system VapB family antitoxin [Actinomycetota bacterium]